MASAHLCHQTAPRLQWGTGGRCRRHCTLSVRCSAQAPPDGGHTSCLRLPETIDYYPDEQSSDTDVLSDPTVSLDFAQRQLLGGESLITQPPADSRLPVTHGAYVVHGPVKLYRVGPCMLRCELGSGAFVEVVGSQLQGHVAVVLPPETEVVNTQPSSTPAQGSNTPTSRTSTTRPRDQRDPGSSSGSDDTTRPPLVKLYAPSCLLAGEHMHVQGPLSYSSASYDGASDFDQVTLQGNSQPAAGPPVGAACASYSDAWPQAVPGVMHRFDGQTLLSVHALPEEEGFYIELLPGCVMSHPLNMVPVEDS